MSEDVPSCSDGESPLRGAGDNGDSPGAGDDRAIGRSYAQGTPLDRGQRLHELFPARYLTIGLLAAIGLTLVGGLATLHVWRRSLMDALAFDAHQTSALDLSAAGNASQWFAAMLLGLSAWVAVFIYSLRRHRLDDYNGRYRVWLWTAGGCLVASLGETTTVDLLGRGLCERIAGTCGLIGWNVWPAAVGIPLVALAIRLLIEVRRCRLAMATLTVATIGFLAAAAVDLGLVAVVSGDTAAFVQRGSWLTGYVLMLTSFLLYTRHVMREIAGLIATPARKVRRKKKTHVTASVPEIADVLPQQQRTNSRTDLDPVKRSVSASDSYASRSETLRIDTQHERGLSKAERRRLRREARESA